MIFDAIVVAAGSGTRAGGLDEGVRKQWRRVRGKPVVRWSVEGLIAAGARRVVVVVPPGEAGEAEAALAGLDGWQAVEGAEARSGSVRNGLEALVHDAPEAVLVHDAARPFVVARHVADLLELLTDADGAVPALPVADTLKRSRTGGLIEETAPRAHLYRAQTPQAFHFETLRAAYANLADRDEPTDDAALVERAGGRVRLAPGDPRLMKLTYPEDFTMAEALAGGARQVRVGQGLDAHRWGPGEAVWLCGVRVDHDQALIGHSDADAGLHAITDAILGAIGAGDIGDHFPPTDPQWKGAASDLFVKHAVELVARRGGRLLNVDVTLVCERPKIKPHREAMRARLADLLMLKPDAVSVKATTTEGMGFTGRQEGLAAQAVVSVELPV